MRENPLRDRAMNSTSQLSLSRLTLCIAVLAASLHFGSKLYASDNSPVTPTLDPFSENMPTVEAAALHTQTLDEAAADVTVITREQIRTYGYRTFGEALAGVRGFYITNDHVYSYAGVRGFSLPGDFNTRFLVMINGHAMTDDVYSSNGNFGQDFGLDMDLVERIEIIRGPSSALYGSNGIFATINVVTISPVDFGETYATAEGGSFGEKKGMVAGSYYLGKGANLLISASVFNNTGQSFYFPQLDTPPFGNGYAIGMDGEKGYHSFANLTWGNWSVFASFGNRFKNVPVAWVYDANSLFSRGNYIDDGRDYVSAVYKRTMGPGDLRWEISYDRYLYHDRFDLIVADGLENTASHADGDWVMSRLSYQMPAGAFGTITAGIEGTFDLKNLQYDLEVTPQPQELIRIDRPGRNGALFLQDEKQLSTHWSLDVGVRLDASRYYGEFLSPRAALVFRPSKKNVYKFIYGRPFRDPNAYEQFYYDNVAFFPALPLRPETANTFEVSLEHHFTPSVSGTIDAFDYTVNHLIQAIYGDDGTSRFENVAGMRSQGIEFELGGKLRPWIETVGSFTWQKVYQDAPGPVADSPARLGKFRWSMPAGRRFTVAGSILAMSSRYGSQGEKTRPVLLADLTLTVHKLPWGCDLQMGVRNALNWSYQDPIGLSLDLMPGDPRSAFVKLIWSPGK